jgi:hypothetical protein
MTRRWRQRAVWLHVLTSVGWMAQAMSLCVLLSVGFTSVDPGPATAMAHARCTGFSVRRAGRCRRG